MFFLSKGFFSEKNAQSSFEMIVISAIVVSLALVALAQIPKIAVSTGALSILKSEILNEFSKHDKFYYIENINSPEWNDTANRTDIEAYVGGNDITQISQGILDKAYLLQDLNLCVNCHIIVQQAGK